MKNNEANKGRLREHSDLLIYIYNIISQESQKMKREKRGQKVYSRKLYLKTSLTWERTQISKNKKQRELPLDPTRAGGC